MLKPSLLAPWFLTLCLMAGTVVPAQAQKATAAPEVAPVCDPDVKKFCPGIHPGEGKIAECLKKNLDALAPDCKVKVSQGVCWSDVDKLCPTVEPGLNRIHDCLHTNAVMLSAQCRVYYQLRIKD